MKLIIIILVVLNQMIFKIQAIKQVDSSFIEYKTNSVWLQKRTIKEERLVCLEICKDCFNDVIFLHDIYSLK